MDSWNVHFLILLLISNEIFSSLFFVCWWNEITQMLVHWNFIRWTANHHHFSWFLWLCCFRSVKHINPLKRFMKLYFMFVYRFQWLYQIVQIIIFMKYRTLSVGHTKPNGTDEELSGEPQWKIWKHEKLHGFTSECNNIIFYNSKCAHYSFAHAYQTAQKQMFFVFFFFVVAVIAIMIIMNFCCPFST